MSKIKLFEFRQRLNLNYFSNGGLLQVIRKELGLKNYQSSAALAGLQTTEEWKKQPKHF